MGILQLCLRGAKGFLKSSNFLGKASSGTKNMAKVSEKPLFCHEYWAAAKANGLVKNSNNKSVKMHEYLNSINHHFLISAYPEQMNLVHPQTNKTVRRMISETDFEFKSLLPTTENHTVFRAIGEKPEFFSEFKFYEKARRVKPGDIINMNEYAYATSDINYAKGYLPNDRGILYRMEIPETAKVSRIGELGKTDEFVFPRSSKWECTGVSNIKNADADYLLVDCRYILPDLF